MSIFVDFIGTIGVLLMLYAYFMSQRGVFSVNDPRYLWLNLAGAISVIISLVWEWNLPSFLIETTWAIISIYGIWKLRQKA